MYKLPKVGELARKVWSWIHTTLVSLLMDEDEGHRARDRGLGLQS